MITALIPAAGRGVRMGDGGPKALVGIRGRPMILWSIDAIAAVPAVHEILVAAPAESIDAFEAVRAARAAQVEPSSGSAPWRETIVGGATRTESVRRLLDRAKTDRVLVHDAARPCVTTDWVAGLIEELGADLAGVPALAVRDTLKRGDGGLVVETISREGLHAVQTPQLFDRETLRRAHAAAETAVDAADPVTDDAALVERIGVPVRLLRGDPSNLKVTYPEDLELAERMLLRRAQAEGRVSE